MKLDKKNLEKLEAVLNEAESWEHKSGNEFDAFSYLSFRDSSKKYHIECSDLKSSFYSLFENKRNLLNFRESSSCDFRHIPPLVGAAAKGKIDNIKLLIEYGAKSPVYEGIDIRIIDFREINPLIAATINKQNKSLECLLENGARLSLSETLMIRDERHFFNTLGHIYSCHYDWDKDKSDLDKDKGYLDCILLLLKASKRKFAFSEGVFQDFKTCIMDYGATNQAHLLKAFGLRLDSFRPTLNNMAHPWIKFCHENNIVDFIHWRDESGKTILHYIMWADKPETLSYLKSIGMPEVQADIESGLEARKAQIYEQIGRHILHLPIANSLAAIPAKKL